MRNLLIKDFLILGILLAVYFVFRLPNLTVQPIFADEAIYIRWAQIMKAEPTLRFLPLSDGKTPLFMWMMIPLFKIFEDPLFAGRILSVIAGLGTLSGIVFLGWKFLGKRVGMFAGFLYSITPYFVFFDRMALVDSMLAAFSVWSLNFLLLLAKNPRLDLAMGLGYLLGGGLLTKTPAMFNILSLPAGFFIIDWGKQNRHKRLVKFLSLLAVGILIGLGIYNILRLGPNFSSLSSRNQDYVISPQTLLIRPWDPFLPHLYDLADWYPKLLGLPLILAVLCGLLLILFNNKILDRKFLLVVLIWGGISLFIQMVFLKTFTARYVLFSTIPFLVIGAWALYYVLEKFNKIRYLQYILAVVFAIWPLYFNWLLLFDLEKAPLPKNERTGYLEDWTAGYGFPEIAKYLVKESGKGVIVVGTEGSFGTLPDGLQIYLDKHAHIAGEGNKIVVIGGGSLVSKQVREAANEHPSFFVANKSRLKNIEEGLELIKEYPKFKGLDGRQDAIMFFKVKPADFSKSEE